MSALPRIRERPARSLRSPSSARARLCWRGRAELGVRDERAAARRQRRGMARPPGRRDALDHGGLGTVVDCYREIIVVGYEQNPDLRAEGGGRRPMRTKAQNLLLRLDDREAEVLRFAHDFQVPFDNNLCERNLRMVKLQQKISGCWRTCEGAERFLAIRSYLSTARKQSQQPSEVLTKLADGEPWLPMAADTIVDGQLTASRLGYRAFQTLTGSEPPRSARQSRPTRRCAGTLRVRAGRVPRARPDCA
jgi:hypothetical protein